MCLIAWDWQPGSVQPLLLLANRDEFYARPAQALHWWKDSPVLAGKDLTGGGTWLGITRCGHLAALTNYRDPAGFRAEAPSRGSLVADFLQGTASAADYLQSVLNVVDAFNPFNLLVYDGNQLLGLESRNKRVVPLGPGIGAVSNADFHTPWPKAIKLRAGLEHLQRQPLAPTDAALWDLLRDDQVAPDVQLPRTGIALPRERALSAAFIRTPDYGTRASTLLRISVKGTTMEEQTFDRKGQTGTTQFKL
jgi:uncharacterized protein with NRDE domain